MYFSSTCRLCLMCLILHRRKSPSRRLIETSWFMVLCNFASSFLPMDCIWVSYHFGIAGKHAERTDQHGFVSREWVLRLYLWFHSFVICNCHLLFNWCVDVDLLLFFRFRRRVMLPKGVDPDSVTSTMTPDGIITITAPKLALEGKQSSCLLADTDI